MDGLYVDGHSSVRSWATGVLRGLETNYFDSASADWSQLILRHVMQDVFIDVLHRMIAAPARQRHYGEADASVHMYL